jgi:hypothetical protein
MSGIHMLPYSLVAALIAIVTGQIVARTGKYRPVIQFGMVGSFSSLPFAWLSMGLLCTLEQATMTLGFGLLIMVC